MVVQGFSEELSITLSPGGREGASDAGGCGCRQVSIHSRRKIMCNVCRAEWRKERPQRWAVSS